MILLLSSDGDFSTDLVIQWLKSFGYTSYFRLNLLDLVEKDVEIDPAEGTFSLNGERIALNTINVVWYRRFSGFSLSSHYRKVKNELGERAAELLRCELQNISEFFEQMLPNVPIIGSRIKGNTNKLIELHTAKKVGLNVPFSMVLSRRPKLLKVRAKHPRLISKSAYNTRSIELEDRYYSMFTTRVNDNDIASVDICFFPSLIQEEIKKDYEVRIFYFLGKFYCMAIISQGNPQTEVDFRKYDDKLPNRFIPCEIDDDTKSKIAIFMSEMGLNIGSLDFIRGTDGLLYFLEVNHMGQFGMVDFPCNYGIHRDIARTLMEMDNITRNEHSR